MFTTHLDSKGKIMLPADFLHPEIAQKYEDFLGSDTVDGSPRTDPIEFLAGKVKSFDPGNAVDFGSTQQTRYAGKQNRFKNTSRDKFDVWSRDVTIEFANDDFLPYIMVMEEMFRRQSSGAKEDRYLDDMTVIHMDMRETPLMSFTYKNLLFAGLSDAILDFKDTDEPTDFTVTLNASGVSVKRLI